MDTNTTLSSKMTSSNLNNIVRTNLKLNSKILSKNTSEIVNTCIGKLYKQIPMTFKSDLQHAKISVAAAKSKNRGPLERLKMLDRQRPLKAMTNIYDTQILNDLMDMSKKPPAFIGEKLLKTPYYKMNNRKRYCSSASSSSGSLLYSKDNNQGSIRGYHTPAIQNLSKRSSITKNNLMYPKASTRNQHLSSHERSLQRTIEVSGKIQRDLMAIDKLLQNRFKSMGKSKDALKTVKTGENYKFETGISSGDYRDVKAKEVEVLKTSQLTNLTSKTTTPRVCKKKYSSSKETVESSKLHKYLTLTALQDKNPSTVQTDVREEENNFKLNSKKQFRSTYKSRENITDKIVNKFKPNRSSNSKSKLIRTATPSATYCLAKPNRSSLIK